MLSPPLHLRSLSLTEPASSDLLRDASIAELLPWAADWPSGDPTAWEPPQTSADMLHSTRCVPRMVDQK